MDAAMMIQLVLSALLLPLALFVALQRATSRLLRLIALAMMATGLYLVWQPEQANWLARGLGVGRGADDQSSFAGSPALQAGSSERSRSE
jgi:hypothetical protein